MRIIGTLIFFTILILIYRNQTASNYDRIPFHPVGPVVDNSGKWYERSQIRDVIKKHVDAENYTRLEAMVEEARTQKLKFNTTVSVLLDLYDGIAYSLPDFPEIHAMIKQWRKVNPKSNIPDILEARAYHAQAWQIRGNGYVSYVSDEQFEGFSDYLNRSWQSVVLAEQKGPLDAELCKLKTALYFTHIKSKTKAYEQFNRCRDVDPSYIPLYATMRVYLQRIWHGSDFELKQFIERAAEETQSIYGDGMYAMLVSDHTFFTGKVFTPAGGSYSWPRVKAGFEDLFKVFGETRHVLHLFAYCAMLAEDYQILGAILDKLGTQWDEEKEMYFKKKPWYNYHLKRVKPHLSQP